MTDLPVNAKIQAILLDIETGHNAVNRSFSSSTNLRNLSLTVTLAYSGFLLASVNVSVFLFVTHALFVLLIIYADSWEKLVMQFDGGSVREAQLIFMERDPDVFRETVENYEFRDHQLVKIKQIGSLKEQLRFMFRRDLFGWYVPQFLLTLGIVLARSNGVF